MVGGAATGAMGGGLAGKAAKWLGNKSASREMVKRMGSASKPLDIDEMIAAAQAKARGATPATPPPAATPTAKSFTDELNKRIDWRITDAVPIDAIKRDITRGGSIIEAGESQVGLAERMAKAMKANNVEEAARLAAAIRQRGHITAKSSR
jgi:hypothetical protein